MIVTESGRLQAQLEIDPLSWKLGFGFRVEQGRIRPCGFGFLVFERHVQEFPFERE